ncbi:hypothetical protein CPB86DRAFT_529360 [Serendipita vermifera]|nr:hypothetical protein CPB86DRAFT_529360 [Serendipita vermifera]
MDAKGAALVVYTGDDEFCKNLRGKARDIGCKLNAKGLWKYPEFVQSSLGEEERWELVPTRSERDVFDYLNEEWVEPDKRNFTNLLAKRRKS